MDGSCKKNVKLNCIQFFYRILEAPYNYISTCMYISKVSLPLTAANIHVHARRWHWHPLAESHWRSEQRIDCRFTLCRCSQPRRCGANVCEARAIDIVCDMSTEEAKGRTRAWRRQPKRMIRGKSNPFTIASTRTRHGNSIGARAEYVSL